MGGEMVAALQTAGAGAGVAAGAQTCKEQSLRLPLDETVGDAVNSLNRSEKGE